ncbi:MAG: cytochrome c [Candidatus Sericytochromatia bacterium]|nr:cytochrome c [Candidatus Sericytochromatia bacterium]
MDFPYFEFPLVGNRYLIAFIATLHVLVNHSAAIGGSLLVVLAEREAIRLGSSDWDDLAYRLARLFFLLTTTVGALSGVGIWFSVMVAAPAGIAAMLHIFFWAWFVEWFVFIAEVAMVLGYFLSWRTFSDRRRHLQLGWAYVLTSFLTLAIITGILGAMLTPGAWLSERAFWGAFFNPSYGPQLVFRTGLALALAGCLGLLLMRWVAPPSLLVPFQRLCGRFLLAAVPLMGLGGCWYLMVLPDRMRALLPTALMTTRFADWSALAGVLHALVCLALFGLGLACLRLGRAAPRAVVWLTGFALVMLLGHFERAREFVRKPFLIPGYMYANGIRVADVPRLNREGLLTHTRWTGIKRPEPGQERAAGQALFRLQCASCHTVAGPNGLAVRLSGQSPQGIHAFLGVQHQVHPFMPPFVGTEAEKHALAGYLSSLRQSPERDARVPGRTLP